MQRIQNILEYSRCILLLVVLGGYGSAYVNTGKSPSVIEHHNVDRLVQNPILESIYVRSSISTKCFKQVAILTINYCSNGICLHLQDLIAINSIFRVFSTVN